MNVDAVLFDLDPLLLQGEAADFASVGAAVNTLRQHDVPLRIVTNNSLHTRRHVAQDLTRRGIVVHEGEVVLPVAHLARWLAQRTPRATVYVLGADSVRHELHDTGIRVIEDPEEIGYLCDYVVAGADPSFAYSSFLKALRCFETGASLVAVEQEPVHRGANGPLPGGGPTVAGLSVMYGKDLLYAAGMPNVALLADTARELDLDPAHCLVVTDARRNAVSVAQQAGMRVVQVGGSDTDSKGGTGDRPTHVLKLRDLAGYLAALR